MVGTSCAAPCAFPITHTHEGAGSFTRTGLHEAGSERRITSRKGEGATMKPEIEATTDFVFKRLFGDEKDTELTIDVLNAVIDAPSPGKRVRSLTLRSPVDEREHSQDKLAVYDIRLSDQGARQYLLEMQRQGLW